MELTTLRQWFVIIGSTIIGALISMPMYGTTEHWRLLSLASTAAGFLIGRRQRSSQLFFYVVLVVLLILLTILGRAELTPPTSMPGVP